MFDDWEDALEGDFEVENKGNEAFEGEELKVEKPKEQEVKQVSAEERERHAKAEAERKKAKAKKYEQAEPERELTQDEMRKREELSRQNDMRLAADLFGNDSGSSIIDLKLENEMDYISFGKVITTKVEKAKSRKWIVEFFGKMFKELEPVFTSKEYQDVQSKINPLLNAAIQKEKGKDGKKKKKAGPSLQVNKAQRENTDLYADYAMDDYGGKDGGNADAGRYEDDDDFM